MLAAAILSAKREEEIQRREERVAFDNLVTERLDATHPDAPSDRCAETPGALGARTSWVAALRLLGPWHKAAAEALAIMGIVGCRKMRPCDERGGRHDRRGLAADD